MNDNNPGNLNAVKDTAPVEPTNEVSSKFKPVVSEEFTADGGPELSLPEMRRLVRIVLWASLIGVGGWITLPLPLVPITLQSFFIVLAGLVEGPKGGAMASGLYLAAGLLGLPIFAGGLGGPAILLGPTAGFALAFPLVGAISGLASPKRAISNGKAGVSWLVMLGTSFVGGVGTLCFCGFVGLVINTELSPAEALKVVLIFVPGGFIKCMAAASVASSRLFK